MRSDYSLEKPIFFSFIGVILSIWILLSFLSLFLLSGNLTLSYLLLLAHGRWFSPASSTTKAGRHDIAEILLKVALTHQK